jgi:guanine deaminase
MSRLPLRKKQVFIGSFIHCLSRSELEYLHETAVFVDEKGVIVRVEESCNVERARGVVKELGWDGEVGFKVGGEGQFFFPGFIGRCTRSFQGLPQDNLALLADST